MSLFGLLQSSVEDLVFQRSGTPLSAPPCLSLKSVLSVAELRLFYVLVTVTDSDCSMQAGSDCVNLHIIALVSVCVCMRVHMIAPLMVCV